MWSKDKATALCQQEGSVYEVAFDVSDSGSLSLVGEPELVGEGDNGRYLEDGRRLVWGEGAVKVDGGDTIKGNVGACYEGGMCKVDGEVR